MVDNKLIGRRPVPSQLGIERDRAVLPEIVARDRQCVANRGVDAPDLQETLIYHVAVDGEVAARAALQPRERVPDPNRAGIGDRSIDAAIAAERAVWCDLDRSASRQSGRRMIRVADR